MEEEQKVTLSKRKLIKKVHKKRLRQQKRFVESYQKSHLKVNQGQKQNAKDKGMTSLLEGAQSLDFDMLNHISTGQNRKLKKKMKKLQKKNLHDDQIFAQMKKCKEEFYKNHQKKIFNSVNELQKRRQKRAKQRDINAKKYRGQVIQKKGTHK